MRRYFHIGAVVVALVGAGSWFLLRPADPLAEIRELPPGTPLGELERRLGTPGRRMSKADVGGWDGAGETLLVWSTPSGAIVSAYVDADSRLVRVGVTVTESP